MSSHLFSTQPSHQGKNDICDKQENLQQMSNQLCLSFEELLKENHQININSISTTQGESSSKKIEDIYQGNGQNQKIYFQKIQQKIIIEKKAIRQNRDIKIKKLKSFLPYIYAIKLPEDYKHILQVGQTIDKHLLKKKKANYKDNVKNIFKKLFQNQQMSSIWSIIKKIMFLTEDLYRIYTDPLKNLTLGLFTKQKVKLQKRKQTLRKALVNYFLTCQKQKTSTDIPQTVIQPLKTFKFYPENMESTNKMQRQENQLKQKDIFISSLKIKVNQKQKQFNQYIITENQEACPKDNELIQITSLTQFCNDICQAYKDMNVRNMYKVSLISKLRKKYSLQKIISLIKVIQKEDLFLEVLIKQDCQILFIRPQEKQKLLYFYGVREKMRQNKIQKSQINFDII